jgi:hypothetical protein
MPLNTNLLRASAGIEMPDQLARMATVEQIRSAQANQETARLNQQARELELADKEEAKTILNQVTSELKSNENIGNARGMIAGLQTHPNKIVRDVGARLKQDLDLYDAQESYISAHPGKVKVGNLGGPDGQPAPVNNLAPQPGATNALVPDQFRQQLDAERQSAAQRARHWEMQALRDPKFAPQAKEARDYFNSFGKINAYEPGRLLMGGGASMMTPPAPAAPSQLSRLINERDLLAPNDPNRKIYDAEILKQTTHPAPVSINLSQSAEKSFGSALAGELAKSDVGLRDAALNAPEAAGNANRILEVLSSGNIIAGPGAEWKLKTAKLLNAFGLPGFVGKDNTELISNTEQLQKSLASQTLDSIKTSGLGAGAGFTNADRDFLEKAKSGNIDMTPETLRRTAELARRSAEATAEKWNTRAKQIPKSAVQGTGLSVEPVGLPSKFEARKTTASDIPQAAVDFLKQGRGTREQFDAQFGAGAAKRVLGN